MSDRGVVPQPSSPGSELVEVVDVDGRVVSIATRDEVRSRNLRHRCTYVAVLTSDDELIVHQRADWKDVFPAFWDIVFGGLAGVGEGWEEAAARELAEEAGIVDQTLVDLGPVIYDESDGRIVGRVYALRYDGEVTCPDGEVVAVDQIPMADIGEWLKDRDVCPDSTMLALPLLQAFLERPGR